jgi:hypothetical protein
VFNKQKGTNFLQVILRASHWIELWAELLPEDQRDTITIGCNRILTVAWNCYFQATGWRHIKRIEAWRWIDFVCFSSLFGWLLSHP